MAFWGQNYYRYCTVLYENFPSIKILSKLYNFPGGMYGHTYSKSVDQPGKVANPACGQLKREN